MVGMSAAANQAVMNQGSTKAFHKIEDVVESNEEHTETDLWREVPDKDSSDCLKFGAVMKQCAGGRHDWQARDAYLTKTSFILTNPNEVLARDYIMLAEIAKVRHHSMASSDVISQQAAGKAQTPSPGWQKAKDLVSRSFRKSASTRVNGETPRGEQEVRMGLCIETAAEATMGARTFIVTADNRSEVDEWIDRIRAAQKLCIAEINSRKSYVYVVRIKMSRTYDSFRVQLFFAVVIAANFTVNIVEKWHLPEERGDEVATAVFFYFDCIFTGIFTLELLWNMGANLVVRFLFDLWNIFDTIVVVASILSLIPSLELPGVSVLRLLRVFRAVRLFRKLSSLRVLFNALLKSLAPVTSSLIILFIITSMYSIIAVELFGFRSPDFRNFHEAIFSMWQVTTGDSWGGMLARSLFYVCQDVETKEFIGSPSPPPDLGFEPGDCGEGAQSVFDQSVLVFFASYSIVSGMVLLNVIVAVLLDQFLRCVADEEKIMREEKIAAADKDDQRAPAEFVLDPIMVQLSEFESLEHLQVLLLSLWQRLNVDDVSELSFETLHNALRLLGTKPVIVLTRDDFDHITCQGSLCLSSGSIDYQHFGLIMKRQLEHYTQREMANRIQDPDTNTADMTILSALKMQLSRAPQVHYFEEESEDCSGGGGGRGKAVSSVGAASASPLPVLLNPKPASLAEKRLAFQTTMAARGGMVTSLDPVHRGEVLKAPIQLD
eukprot:Tamp_06010.p1 GENE.Tamp_06010~~Tamp_06010.p1  ORF type:complete len:718 (-),score=178.14 Tamp_06010:564-2717(-)